MRIGIDATMIFDSNPTGFGIYSINIVNELSKLHDDLVIWTIDDSNLRIPKNNVRKVLQSFGFMGKNLYQLRPFWVEFVLPRLIREERINVLYSTIPGELQYCPVPQLVTVHDLIPITFPNDAPFGVRWNYKYRIPLILKNSSAIIVDSEHTKKDVLRCYGINPEKIHTVYLGYDPHHFSPRHDSAVLERYGLEFKKYILSVGNAQPRKNLIRLLEAFADIKEKIPHTLVLLGPKASRDLRRLKTHIDKLRVNDRVMLLNYISYEELPVLYSGAVLFAYLSLYEGFGLPVIEAMACGTPVIASNTTSIPEVAGEAAILVDPTNTEIIAKKILEILLNQDKLNELASKGLKHCAQFSWKKAAKSISSILKEIGRG
jgi:glycosyltransferase involved in cell wall biosynthesis